MATDGIHERGGAAGENQCRLVVMSRKPELFARRSVVSDVILALCPAPRDNKTFRDFGTRLAPRCKFMSRCQRHDHLFTGRRTSTYYSDNGSRIPCNSLPVNLFVTHEPPTEFLPKKTGAEGAPVGFTS